MSTRFLLCTFALGIGAATACSGATNTGLFAPGDDSSNGGGTDSGSTGGGDSTTPPQDSGGMMTPDTGMMQQPDASSPPHDASEPPHDSAPPPVDSAPPDPGVQCADAPGGHCSVPDESCCVEGLGGATTPVGTCTQSGECFQGVEVPCDNAAECDEIDPGQGEVCCATTDATGVATQVACAAPSDCMDTTNAVVCDPNDSTACPAGTTCRQSTRTLPGYYLCLN
jgi:hypothetical protein